MVANTSKLLAGICPRCKRRDVDGCDFWCPGVAETIETPGPGATVIRQGIATVDAIDVPPVRPITFEQRADRGRQTQAANRAAAATPPIKEPVVSLPDLYPCTRCPDMKPAELFQRARDGGPKSLCLACMRTAQKAGMKRAAQPTSEPAVSRSVATVGETPVTSEPAVSEPVSQPERVDVFVTVADQPAVHIQSPPPTSAADLQTKTERIVGPWGVETRLSVDISVNDEPVTIALDAAGPETHLANLTAERERLAEHLDRIDAEIADLTAVQSMADKSTDELQRLARWVTLALEMRGAA